MPPIGQSVSRWRETKLWERPTVCVTTIVTESDPRDASRRLPEAFSGIVTTFVRPAATVAAARPTTTEIVVCFGFLPLALFGDASGPVSAARGA